MLVGVLCRRWQSSSSRGSSAWRGVSFRYTGAGDDAPHTARHKWENRATDESRENYRAEPVRNANNSNNTFSRKDLRKKRVLYSSDREQPMVKNIYNDSDKHDRNGYYSNANTNKQDEYENRYVSERRLTKPLQSNDDDHYPLDRNVPRQRGYKKNSNVDGHSKDNPHHGKNQHNRPNTKHWEAFDERDDANTGGLSQQHSNENKRHLDKRNGNYWNKGKSNLSITDKYSTSSKKYYDDSETDSQKSNNKGHLERECGDNYRSMKSDYRSKYSSNKRLSDNDSFKALLSLPNALANIDTRFIPNINKLELDEHTEVLYGVHPVLLALTANRRLIHAVYCKTDLEKSNAKIKDIETLAKERNMSFEYMEGKVIKRIFRGDYVHQNIFCVASRLPVTNITPENIDKYLGNIDPSIGSVSYDIPAPASSTVDYYDIPAPASSTVDYYDIPAPASSTVDYSSSEANRCDTPIEEDLTLKISNISNMKSVDLCSAEDFNGSGDVDPLFNKENSLKTSIHESLNENYLDSEKEKPLESYTLSSSTIIKNVEPAILVDGKQVDRETEETVQSTNEEEFIKTESRMTMRTGIETDTEIATKSEVTQPCGGERGRLWVLLDAVVDPRNLGAVLRSCGFFGVSRVLLTRSCSPVNAVVSKASSGAAELLPISLLLAPHRTLTALRQRGWRLVTTRAISLSDHELSTDVDHQQSASPNNSTAATPGHTAASATAGPSSTSGDVSAPPSEGDKSVRPVTHLTAQEFRPQGDTLLIIGNEGHGVSDELYGLSDCVVTIPGAGPVSAAVGCLNLSVATAILLHAASHQSTRS